MILTISLILASLVALNFLLLLFSCNKTTKKTDSRLPRTLKTEKKATTKPIPSTTLVASQLKSRQLAPTGS